MWKPFFFFFFPPQSQKKKKRSAITFGLMLNGYKDNKNILLLQWSRKSLSLIPRLHSLLPHGLGTIPSSPFSLWFSLVEYSLCLLLILDCFFAAPGLTALVGGRPKVYVSPCTYVSLDPDSCVMFQCQSPWLQTFLRLTFTIYVSSQPSIFNIIQDTHNFCKLG